MVPPLTGAATAVLTVAFALGAAIYGVYKEISTRRQESYKYTHPFDDYTDFYVPKHKPILSGRKPQASEKKKDTQPFSTTSPSKPAPAWGNPQESRPNQGTNTHNLSTTSPSKTAPGWGNPQGSRPNQGTNTHNLSTTSPSKTVVTVHPKKSEQNNGRHTHNVSTVSPSQPSGNLRRRRYRNVEDKCTICNEPITSQKSYRILECWHKYHYSCIKKFLKVIQNCPDCGFPAQLTYIDYNKKALSGTISKREF